VIFAVVVPVLAVTALLIRVTSTGPVLIRQPRVRPDGSHYNAFRFRTQDASAEDAKIGKDRSITRVGRFVRRWSLDELPHLFNVLRGEAPLLPPGMTWRQVLQLLFRRPR
jgi:lipopolysaccharide/colanic/teichoic acid biosynthesis glycosyltransferase